MIFSYPNSIFQWIIIYFLFMKICRKFWKTQMKTLNNKLSKILNFFFYDFSKDYCDIIYFSSLRVLFFKFLSLKIERRLVRVSEWAGVRHAADPICDLWQGFHFLFLNILIFFLQIINILFSFRFQWSRASRFIMDDGDIEIIPQAIAPNHYHIIFR